MISSIKANQSLPEYLLGQEGNSTTYEELLDALTGASNQDLEALDDDIDFYMQTGLVGVHMSRLIPSLSVSNPKKADILGGSGHQSNVVNYLDWKRRTVGRAA